MLLLSGGTHLTCVNRTNFGRMLVPDIHFEYSGNVEMKQAIDALAALAHETRLNVFRLLVEAGPGGLAAGTISERLDLPPATLSFHLAHLARAGLAVARQQGRFIIYSANFESTNQLVGYLTDNCCGGRSCAPAAKPGPMKGTAKSARRLRPTSA